MGILKKFKGYLILSVIFIIVIIIIYLSTSGKRKTEYITLPDTSFRTHIIDSLNWTISELKEDNLYIKESTEKIKIKIKENETEYKNKINIIEHTCADSNYDALRDLLRAEQ
jgi:hypothetical protein